MKKLGLILLTCALAFGCAAQNRTFANLGYAGRDCFVFGDSISFGYVLANPTLKFSTLLARQYAMKENNLAVSGTQIIDSGEQQMIWSNSITANSVSLWLAGYNDMRYYGNNAAALADNQQAVQAQLAYLAIPLGVRKTCTDASITYAGSWSSLATGFLDPSGLKYSTGTGATAAFTVTGTTIIIWTGRDAPSVGTLTVTVDGGNTKTFNCLSTSAATSAGSVFYSSVVIYTNLSLASHAVLITAPSTPIYFAGYAGYTNQQTPKVVVMAGLKMPTASYSANSPFNNGSDANAIAWANMISNSAAALSGAQLDIQYKLAPVLDTTADFESDGVHPNELGHEKIKSFFSSMFNSSPGSIYVAPASTGSGTGLSTADPVVTIGNPGDSSASRSLTGTANEVTVTDNGAGSTVVLSTPQAIGTGSSVTFAGINDSALTASTATATDASKNLVSSSTTATELGYVHNVTSAIQTQINGLTPTNTAVSLTFSQAANQFTGTFTGNGQPLTNMVVAVLGSGISAASFTANQVKYVSINGTSLSVVGGGATEANVPSVIAVQAPFTLSNLVITHSSGALGVGTNLVFRIFTNDVYAGFALQDTGSAATSYVTNDSTSSIVMGAGAWTNKYSLQISNTAAGTTATLNIGWSLQAVK